MTPEAAWKVRSEHIAEGYAVLVKDDSLRSAVRALEIKARGEQIFTDAIRATFGDIKMEWIMRDGKYDCHLENGQIYKWDMFSV
jgi:hypothetical protein